MIVDRDVQIPMADGIALAADVFRPGRPAARPGDHEYGSLQRGPPFPTANTALAPIARQAQDAQNRLVWVRTRPWVTHMYSSLEGQPILRHSGRVCSCLPG
jgi:hypothetical protein